MRIQSQLGKANALVTEWSRWVIRDINLKKNKRLISSLRIQLRH